MKIKARIGKESFELNISREKGDEKIQFPDGETILFLRQFTAGICYARYRNKIHAVHVKETGSGYQIQIGQDHFQVNIEDKQSILLESLGMKTSRKETDGVVKAPIPGLLMKLLVSTGDKVQSGQALAILEAMKMENEIHAPHGGSIAEIYAKEGEQVDKDQPILKIKDS